MDTAAEMRDLADANFVIDRDRDRDRDREHDSHRAQGRTRNRESRSSRSMGDVMGNAGACASCKRAACRRLEECPGLVGVSGGDLADIDDSPSSLQGVLESVTGAVVDTGATSQDNGVVSGMVQRRHEVSTYDAGSAHN